MDQPNIKPSTLLDSIKEGMAAQGLPFVVAERISQHYLPAAVSNTPIPTLTTNTTTEVTMSALITLAGPLTRILEKDERSPINSALSRAKQPTLGKRPSVQHAINTLATIGVQVAIEGEKASSPRVQHYVPVNKTHFWKGQPVSKARFDHLLVMSKGVLPANSGEHFDEVDSPTPAVTQALIEISQGEPNPAGPIDLDALLADLQNTVSNL